MSEYRPELPTVPVRMRTLPIQRGYPVPWFVAEVNGEFHFPTADARKLIQAVKRKLCWVCGQPLGTYRTFVIGPMCAVNKTTSEPPCHADCATFSAIACPFLSRPHMKRVAEKNKAEGAHPPPGNYLERNPGCACVWTTRDYWLRKVDHGFLFRIGAPTSVEWYAHGRAATREEVMESITSGLPLLKKVAQDHGEVEDLDRAYTEALRLVPA